ncbi:MAG: ABC transporter [Phycisphaeraceae bacterium]|nr:ABC transporter [Phycisphaeraceae bacterium]
MSDTAAPAIETRGLTVRFGAVPGVLDLDLEVQVGEVFGFLGPNGAGKTTTIRTLLDLLRPDSGDARIFGTEVRSGGGALRADIGYLPGDLALFASLTGSQTLRLFERLVDRAPVLRDEVLERLNLDDEALRRRVRTFSTGMRQKLGIVCAFQHDPRLLILDEPTTGLDPLGRDAFLELVRSRRAAGRTVFLSSHVLDEIDRCADRVGLVASSRLRLVAPVQQLRATRPRRVALRYEGGRTESFTYTGSPGEMLAELDTDGLVDLEVRAASLDDVFRAVVQTEDPASGEGES